MVGISVEQQCKWRDPSKALRSWKEAIESLGIFVMQNSSSSERIPIEVFRGFVMDFTPFPIIVINGADAPNGRIFTLLHELCHLIHLRAAAQQRLKKKYITPKYLEIVCNRVAAEFLCPEDDIRKIYQSFSSISRQDHNITGIELARLANQFSTSKEMLLNRLEQLGLISPENKDASLTEIATAFSNRSKEKILIIIPQHTMAISRNGKSMSSIVVDALQHKQITSGDASECLGIKTKYLAKVRDAVITSAS